MNLRVPNDVVFRDLAGEAVMLNLTTGVYFGLDTVATRMWHLIAECGSTETVLEVLLTEYEVEEARLRHDLDNLIRQLLEKGLITTDAENTPKVG